MICLKSWTSCENVPIDVSLCCVIYHRLVSSSSMQLSIVIYAICNKKDAKVSRCTMCVFVGELKIEYVIDSVRLKWWNEAMHNAHTIHILLHLETKWRSRQDRGNCSLFTVHPEDYSFKNPLTIEHEEEQKERVKKWILNASILYSNCCCTLYTVHHWIIHTYSNLLCPMSNYTISVMRRYVPKCNERFKNVFECKSVIK